MKSTVILICVRAPLPYPSCWLWVPHLSLLVLVSPPWCLSIGFWGGFRLAGVIWACQLFLAIRWETETTQALTSRSWALHLGNDDNLPGGWVGWSPVVPPDLDNFRLLYRLRWVGEERRHVSWLGREEKLHQPRVSYRARPGHGSHLPWWKRRYNVMKVCFKKKKK